MKRLAIIPARIGSKRIHKKNIRDFLGKPIISYSIEAAVQACIFDEIMVSTDSQEIAEVSQKYGAAIPFFRSEKNANDFATLADVVEEVIFAYQQKGINFDFICCILPTAPFITPDKITEAFNWLQKHNFDSVTPVIRFSYPIQRALKVSESKHLKMFSSQYLNTRSQDLEPAYHDSGQFYWGKVNAFLKERTFFLKNAGAIIISEREAQDIDTLEDWKLAEMKYQLLHGKK